MDGESLPGLDTCTTSAENPKLLQLVFSFLPPIQLAVSACVSRSWKHVAGSDKIWTDICLKRWPSFAKSSLYQPDARIVPDAKSVFSRLNNKAGVKLAVCEDFEILLTFRFKGQIIHSACLPFKNELFFHPFPKLIPLHSFRSTNSMPLIKENLLGCMGNGPVDRYSRKKVATLVNAFVRELSSEVILVKENGHICKISQDLPFSFIDVEFESWVALQPDALIAVDNSSRVVLGQNKHVGLNSGEYCFNGHYCKGDIIFLEIQIFGRLVDVRGEDGTDEFRLELLDCALFIQGTSNDSSDFVNATHQVPFLPWT